MCDSESEDLVAEAEAVANDEAVGNNRRRDRHYCLYESYKHKVHEAEEQKKLQEHDVSPVGKESQKHHTEVLE
jgi:hypothetical protein